MREGERNPPNVASMLSFFLTSFLSIPSNRASPPELSLEPTQLYTSGEKYVYYRKPPPHSLFPLYFFSLSLLFRSLAKPTSSGYRIGFLLLFRN